MPKKRLTPGPSSGPAPAPPAGPAAPSFSQRLKGGIKKQAQKSKDQIAGNAGLNDPKKKKDKDKNEMLELLNQLQAWVSGANGENPIVNAQKNLADKFKNRNQKPGDQQQQGSDTPGNNATPAGTAANPNSPNPANVNATGTSRLQVGPRASSSGQKQIDEDKDESKSDADHSEDADSSKESAVGPESEESAVGPESEESAVGHESEESPVGPDGSDSDSIEMSAHPDSPSSDPKSSLDSTPAPKDPQTPSGPEESPQGPDAGPSADSDDSPEGPGLGGP